MINTFFRFYNLPIEEIENFKNELLALDISKDIDHIDIKKTTDTMNPILPADTEIQQVLVFFETEEKLKKFVDQSNIFLPIYKKYSEKSEITKNSEVTIRKPGDTKFVY